MWILNPNTLTTLFYFKTVVVDEMGVPIVGAQITTKNKTYYTDFNGVVKIIDDGDGVVVSMISYKDTLLYKPYPDTVPMKSNHP
jgi:hypothetical protein